jgi:succinate-semialdehyde dehydrogenase / glutarate-semialdehyde dehydrogenase
MAIATINPATGELIKSFDALSDAQIEQKLHLATETFRSYKSVPYSKRAEMMLRAAEILEKEKEAFGRVMTLEMGKPIRAAVEEAAKCAVGCRYYAENAERFLADEVVETSASRSFIRYQPLGPVLAVMPWNFPFWQVFRFAAPGLMAGNAAVLKHASNVPGCALAIEDVFRRAGFPKNLFRTLMIGSPQVTSVIEHPLVRAVTLTGSGPAGRAVAGKAGQMLKKTVLELGGSDPYLVLEDADLEMAAAVSTKGRLVNAGQSCIAAKRFIVPEKIRRPFEDLFVQKMGAVKMGDPLNEDTQIGPLARHDLRDELHRQVEASIAGGARCLLGGAVPNNPGAYYPPTVLTDVRRGMPAYEEELFGPVAAIISVKDEEEAIATANDSAFGLGGGVITRDLARGEHIAAERIESGCVFVNEAVRSDPRLPFGGVKESGYGRELSVYGIKEFVNIKTVYVG